MIKLFALLLLAALVSSAIAQAPKRRGRGSRLMNPLPPPGGNSQSSRGRGNRRGRGRGRGNGGGGDGGEVSPECEAVTIRTITGRCTSEVDPTLGEARRPQFSYLGVSNDELEDAGLPSARSISNIVSGQDGRTSNSQGLNEMFTYFGQFIDHDFALSPFSEPEERDNIRVPADDPELSIPFLDFIRSERARVSASSSVVRPITVLTSALDLSNVYGSDEERNEFLRVRNSCLLKTSGDELLPLNTAGFVNAPSTSANLFIAGDPRANETPMLTAMHTIWVREHNRICGLLEESFPEFSAERQYETARAINIAEYQKIIYEEWLPAILGRERLPRYNGYNPSVNPTVSLEFTTAGFRLGHTLVSEDVPRVDNNGRELRSIPAEEMFFLPSSEISADEIENVLRAASVTRAQEFDEKVVDTLRNFLFENVEGEEGFDLVALNLQRSRDHNVPKFNELRRFFLRSPARSFRDISGDTTTAANLEEAYGDVDNVEAWIGLVAEDKARGVGVGRTLAELLKTEFARLRDGDRFFYLRRNQIPSEVLRELRDVDRDIFRNDPLFNSILLRTTSISSRILNARRSAFRT